MQSHPQPLSLSTLIQFPTVLICTPEQHETQINSLLRAETPITKLINALISAEHTNIFYSKTKVSRASFVHTGVYNRLDFRQQIVISANILD